MNRSTIKKFTPAFEKAIDEAARKVFGYLPQVNERTGLKLLKRKPVGPVLMQHYLPDMKKPFYNRLNNFKTKEEEHRQFQLEDLRKRGKGPPKKGQGKRASKGKK